MTGRMPWAMSNREGEVFPLDAVSISQNSIDDGGFALCVVDRERIDSVSMQPIEDLFRHAVFTKERRHRVDTTSHVLRKRFDDGCIRFVHEAFEIGACITNRLNESHVITVRMCHDDALDVGQSMAEFFEGRFQRSPTRRRSRTRINQCQRLTIDQIDLDIFRDGCRSVGHRTGKRKHDLMDLRTIRNRAANERCRGSGSISSPDLAHSRRIA